MKMIIPGFGATLFLLGGSAMNSERLFIPSAMVLIGLSIIYISAKGGILE